MTKTIIVFSAALFAMGCGQHPFDEYESATEELAEDACSCPDLVSAAGYASAAECVVDNSLQFTEAERQCLKDAYDRNESAAAPSVSCTLDQARSLNDCINRASCNPVAIQSCFDSFDIEAACPSLPSTVQAEFDACFPEPSG